ncbi:hypothetical protein QN277_010737 [Acacia crassicarpa]|uniref:Bromo domain-containing protein n=1 Tax=Acacia crassicarpa TaxID=499986 RepID=A0AAE1JL19_9FABA|nr:hypothetical protein QN277_010737 [Acacia crassicarpa]
MRKSQRATLKEARRRSLRISTMEGMQTHGSSDDPIGKSGNTTCTEKMVRHWENDLGPASRTRGTKKRKLRPVEELTISPAKQDVFTTYSNHLQQKKQCDEDIKRKNDQPPELTSAIFMPEKHVLERILNILQRRDTYEIFAEPVDPKEVEDYYEIIEEPMDFGTMRAKLHEEMYKSLEQFEHDVFLIFNNAMHFNSSRTMYFKQARTMNELAKKVFNVLKAKPENFEREFSETIQRDGSSNVPPYRKSLKANHGRSDIARHVDARILDENPTGARKSGRCKSFEVDRRCTYRPYMSPGEDESIFQTIYGNLKLFEQVNQQGIGYRESLMLFVNDLGQEVKNIVRRKLVGYEIHTRSNLAPLRPNTLNTYTDPDEIRRATDNINLEIASGDKVVYVNDDIYHDQVERTPTAGQGKVVHSPLKDNIQGSQSMPFECDQSYWSALDHSRASADKLDCLADGSKRMGSEPTTILSDKSKSSIQGQVSESSILEHFQTAMFRNKCEFQSESCPSQSKDVSTSSFMQDKIQIDQEYVGCSFEVGKILQSSQTMPLASNFVFNLPYLKARLDQMNSSEHYSKGGKKHCPVQACFAED